MAFVETEIEDGDGVDPIIGAAIAKAVGSSGETAGAEGGRLLARVLGPAADEIGEGLRRYTNLRMQNVGRIVNKADRKRGRVESDGQVPPRVAHRLLDEGSYCDDELMAEYLGGVLAASKTPDGRDDRAVVWSSLVASMSTLQIRAHFLLYREWAAVLRGRTDINLGKVDASRETRLHVELASFLRGLVQEDGIDYLEALSHSIMGLRRLDLLGNDYGWGKRESMVQSGFTGPYEIALNVTLSQQGLELYGWAQGVSGLSYQDFATRAEVFGEEDLPRLASVAFPLLPERPQEEEAPEAAPLT